MAADSDEERRRRAMAAASPAETMSRSSSRPPGWGGRFRPVFGIITAGWSAIWITAFATGHWDIGLPLMLLSGPVMAAGRGGRGGRNRRSRRGLPSTWGGQGAQPGMPWGATPRSANAPRQDPAPAPAPRPAAAPLPSPERSLAATLVRAESSGSRLDPDALALIREVEGLLRPLLAQVRTRGADAQVRHDLEAIATEHLPAALDAYLALPQTYAHEHRTVTGTTPADELRTQLTLLVEGCRQLGDAVHDADLDRQQQLSRFLEAKFRRSDLDL